MSILGAFAQDRRGSACLRTALAIGATALLPALGWEAGDANRMAVAAVAPQPVVTLTGPAAPETAVTIVGKQGVTWTHAKADRAHPEADRTWQEAELIQPAGEPETVVEIMELASAGPADDADRPDVAEEGSADPAAREAARTEFSGWLAYNEASGALRITGFETMRQPVGRKACRARHDQIVQAFEVDQSRARVLADAVVMFQSRICAANGEIIITCQGSDAVISPRQARPGSACTRS